jgi:hypothetical protein
MPSADWCPRPQLMTACDLRPWASTTIFSGPNPVTLPAYSAAGEGLFGDVVDALCGRASYLGQDLAALADAGWTGGGVPAFSFTINTSDRVEVSAALAFSIWRSGSLGFTGVTPAVLVGARWVATAQADWRRGNWSPVTVNDRPYIDPVPAGANYFLDVNSRSHSVVCSIRSTALTDLDTVDYTKTIQGIDCAANHASIRWGVDSTGRVWRSWSAVAAPVAPVWASLSMMARLGFTGAETAVLSDAGTVATVTATHPCPGVLAPSRPLSEPLVPWSEHEADSARTQAGRVYRVERGLTHGWTASIDLDGLLDDGDDLWEHYRRRWLPYQGDRVTLYQEAGDPRRRGDPQAGDVYGRLRTVQDDGYGHGRIVGVLAESHATTHELVGRSGLYRQAPLVFRLAEVP